MRTLILAAILPGFTMMSCSRELPERKVPSLVQNGFRSKFMDAKDIDWEKSGQFYVVEFEKGRGDDDHKVLLDTLGSIVAYKYEIETSRLPAPVINTIQAKYQEYKVDEVENVEKGGVTYYQVELERGQKKQQMVFSANGALNNNITYWD